MTPPSITAPFTAPCHDQSLTSGEPLAATAPAGQGSWLLVEHPGPWPAREPWRALPEPLALLAARARDHGVTVGLIRRVTDRGPVAAPTLLLASNRGAAPWLRRLRLDAGAADDAGADHASADHASAVAGVDLAALAAGDPPAAGTADAGRVLLVCTHGRRDTCCARLGRPVALALAERHGDTVWETTHLGGHRFAGNLLCLPEGTLHGRLTAEAAPRVAAACLAGEVDPEYYRGRAGAAAIEQAAEEAVRRLVGARGVAAVTVERAAATTADGEDGPRRLRVVSGACRYTVALHPVVTDAVAASCGEVAASVAGYRGEVVAVQPLSG